MRAVFSIRPRSRYFEGVVTPLADEIEGETVRSVTILTTEPNEVVAPIHDRMPVVLPGGRERKWLEAGPKERQDLCQPYPGDDLDAYPISTYVNAPNNDSPAVIELAESEKGGLNDF